MPSRVTSSDLVRDLARRLRVPPEEAEKYLAAVCTTLRAYLQAGNTVELGDLFALGLSGGAEIREDESGGFSAYAPKTRGLQATPIGALKSDLEKSCQQAIYYISRDGGQFTELLTDHFGRRGWQLVHTRNGMEVQSRMERFPPVALIFESHAEGWRELVRELKCNPRTNWVPTVGIFPEGSREEPVTRLTVLPDDFIFEPFDFSDFIRTAASGLAERVTAPHHELTELEIHLPGTRGDRKEAREIVEEVLFRSSLPETFCKEAGGALGEALDNAHRHGHQFVECCTIQARMILDPKRLVIAVRDSGKGFDHVAALAAARGSAGREAKDPLAKAAAALKTRRGGGGKQGGIARMLQLVDRVDYNKHGNEVVLTKLRPPS